MSASRQTLERKAAAVLELKRRRSLKRTVYGIVDPEKGLTHAITSDSKGNWTETQDDIDIYIPAKGEQVLKSKKRFIVLVGGRGSAKSVLAADIAISDTKDNKSKTYFLREFQASIRNSIYSLIKAEIARFGFQLFNVLDKHIGFKDDQAFEFAGLARNIDSVKSTHGFDRFEVEEAQFLSETSLDTLTATLRNKPKNGLPDKFSIVEDIQTNDTFNDVSMIFIANPGSSEDPFSKRFINPYKEILDRDGVYEDDLHLIVKMNYDDNAWFEESGLEKERQWDLEHRSTAFYDHKWLGEYNDSVEDGLIMAEWFDACVDAHLKLGFKAQGAKIASFDPSDTGPDSKGYAMRHGSVFLDVDEKTDQGINEGGDWASDKAIKQHIDYFSWDCDGMGIGLNRQFTQAFKGKSARIVQFKGSESPDNPESSYKHEVGVEGTKLIKDTFRNKRSQYYFILRDRVYLTYRAVVHGEYCDPEQMISYSSDIKELKKLRAELCRMPIKPSSNGFLELYTKEVMKTKFQIASPNLADSAMMSMRYIDDHRPAVVLPPPLRPMSR